MFGHNCLSLILGQNEKLLLLLFWQLLLFKSPIKIRFNIVLFNLKINSFHRENIPFFSYL